MVPNLAWGAIRARSCLPCTARSAIAPTVPNAGCHWEELDIRVNSALRNRMPADEIKEAVIRSASYCSTPAANITL
ncbi:carboxymuconolactone decarboxylase family protein [Paeniglutamicibacter sp. NPDC091659]|uniref:carboxymuconolactone decarboxylase family protein n=1 Tax=Paeniglutamicibacter sp. NPDC091659 TaxID=3364389 RepID=UPI0038004C68